MKFSVKVFFLAFGTAVLCSVSLCLFMYFGMVASQRKQFVQGYYSKLQIVCDTLQQLESAANTIAVSAAKAFQQQEKIEGLKSDEELTEVAKSLHVEHIFVTDKFGKFIRSTNGSVKNYKNTLFDYCSDYRGLISGESSLEQTPIVPSADEAIPGPFKYTMIPNHDRTRVLEVSVPLGFISHTLSKAIETDQNILSLGLYSPNGTPLGYVSKNNTLLLPPLNLESISLNVPHWSADEVEYAMKVRTDIENCCECKIKNISGSEKTYFYILRAKISISDLNKSVASIRLQIALVFVGITIFIGFFAGKLSKLLLGRLTIIRMGVTHITTNNDLSHRLNIPGKDEISQLGQQIDQMTASLEESQKYLIEAEKIKALAYVTEQVAHDIRSPLAALAMVAGNLDQLPEDIRIIIRTAIIRIKDISNNLLDGNAKKAGNRTKKDDEFSVQFLMGLIESVVTEKRMQFRTKLNVEISADFDSSNYGLFSIVHPIEFMRMLSNLINNAVEALLDGGKVTLALRPILNSDSLELRITDNGKGIPTDIISKLMNRGESHGKVGGTGLGLYHARQTVEKMGGSIRLESKLDYGTSVVITVPKASPPEWFVDRISVSRHSKIVVLDDDESIHQVWRGRFDFAQSPENDVRLVHFSSPQELMRWKPNGDVLYLIDYEFLGYSMTGLDVIERLEIESQSILVTSRYDEAAIRERCARLKVSLLPKGMAGFVPISLKSCSDSVIS